MVPLAQLLQRIGHEPAARLLPEPFGFDRLAIVGLDLREPDVKMPL
jgi:hypothetical protein